MGKVILDINNISKSFYNKTSGNNFILQNFDLSIEEHKITALIGGNGTGKTTLFNIISGFLDPDKSKSSKIVFKEKLELLKIPSWKIPQKGIGRLFQDAHIFPGLTIVENMMIAEFSRIGESPLESIFYIKKIKREEKRKKKKVIGILSELFGENSTFVKNADMMAGSLSYGEQRLLSLARLLMGDYQLILLDEPTAGVNPKLVQKIVEIIQLMKLQGKTVFLIEHNMDFIRKAADIVAFITNGKIFTQGTPETVLKNESIIKNYLGLA